MKQIISAGRGTGICGQMLFRYNVNSWQGRKALAKWVNKMRQANPGQYITVEYYNSDNIYGEPSRSELFTNDMVAV